MNKIFYLLYLFLKLKENSKLREAPDNQRFEEELVQVKMREAESQLAIKELQKTIHVLNLEYQEFLNNRSAAIASINVAAVSGNSSLQSLSINRPEYQLMEEELLRVKMREAETQSEMKSIGFKMMQLDTEVSLKKFKNSKVSTSKKKFI